MTSKRSQDVLPTLTNDTEPLPEGAKCPVCACSIFEGADEDPVVWCRRCNTPHHKDCWEYNGGCALYGCREQAPPDQVEVENWPLVLQDYHQWLALTDQKRKIGASFTIMCLMAVTLAIFATDLSVGLFFPFFALLPMAIMGKAYWTLEKQSKDLEENLEPITGTEPFNAMVTARDTTRWMAAAKDSVGNIHTGPMFDIARALLIMTILQFPIIFYLPLFKSFFLLGFDLAVLFAIKDSFISMRKEQSILINRFKTTFAPAIAEKDSKGKMIEETSSQRNT